MANIHLPYLGPILRRSILLATLCPALLPAQVQPSRGIGIYPGRPTEYFGPTLVPDNDQRNLALHRAVYQSSAHDKNLTAQLLTDGERTAGQPARLTVCRNGHPLTTADREKTLNESEWSSIVVEGDEATLTYEWEGMTVDADEVVLEGYVAYDDLRDFDGYTLKCEATAHGRSSTTTLRADTLPGTPYRRKVSSDPNKQIQGEGVPARALKETFALNVGQPLSALKFTLRQKNALYWSVREVTLLKQGKPVRDILPSSHFHSAWLTDDDAWAYVDLGRSALVESVKLYPAAPSGRCDIHISQDAQTWTFVGEMACNRGASRTPVIHVNRPARYVRVSTEGAAAIAEMEVMGRGGLVPQACPEAGWNQERDCYLLDGGGWTLCPLDAEATPCGPEIVATVPATVLSSYHNAGALPDPNYDDQLSMISESYFQRAFLYRRTFSLPPEMRGRHVLLHFDGINWKADVRLNGERLGRIDGAFVRGKFDISEYVRDENTLEVLVHPTAHPGSRKTKTALNTSFNGGVLGADNPTFHATIGWDWITTTPGRDIGIWNDVYLTATEAVSLSDPYVATTLHDSLATMTPSVFLKNHTRESVAGRLEGYIGDIRFEKTVLLEPETEVEVSFSPRQFSQLREQEMHLWWPNGYGEPAMYDAGYTFTPTNTRRSEKTQLTYRTGLREVTYRDEMERLQLYINGRRFIPLGGNWGFSESHLNYRGREYDAAVRYHREMNCNMIRNWVGQTGDEEFYEACDRYGLMVWQDFWLANPVDGPNPDDERMFMQNATDFVRRIRQHPSLALFCGRNEGYPPETLAPYRARHAQYPRGRQHAPNALPRPSVAAGRGLGTARLHPAGRPGRSLLQPHPRGALRPPARTDGQGQPFGLYRAGPVAELRRLPRHVRGIEHPAAGTAHLDEPPLLALHRMADLRLLPLPHRRLFRRTQGLRAAPCAIQCAHRHGPGGKPLTAHLRSQRQRHYLRPAGQPAVAAHGTRRVAHRHHHRLFLGRSVRRAEGHLFPLPHAGAARKPPYPAFQHDKHLRPRHCRFADRPLQRAPHHPVAEPDEGQGHLRGKEYRKEPCPHGTPGTPWQRRRADTARPLQRELLPPDARRDAARQSTLGRRGHPRTKSRAPHLCL